MLGAHVRRGLVGKNTGSFCVPCPCLGKRDRDTHPWAQTAVPCSWAGRVGCYGSFPPSVNVSDGWELSRRGRNPPGTQSSFHGAGTAKSWWVGTEGQDRPGHNRRSVLAAPSPHTHTCTNTQPYINPKHTQQPPTHLHTRADTHLCSPGHSPICLFPGRETRTRVALPMPSDPVAILLPPFRRTGTAQAAHMNSLYTHMQIGEGPLSLIPRQEEGGVRRSTHFTKW